MKTTVNGTSYHVETDPAVIAVLESARINHTRIRVIYGDTQTGCSWLDEHDIRGTIGRSTGTVKIPLIINNSRSMGGPGMLEHCILAIYTCPAGRELYKHPAFVPPVLTIGKPANCPPEYVEGVFDETGANVANFRKHGQAARYVAFMGGERQSP